jgi:hypothetical protein
VISSIASNLHEHYGTTFAVSRSLRLDHALIIVHCIQQTLTAARHPCAPQWSRIKPRRPRTVWCTAGGFSLAYSAVLPDHADAKRNPCRPNGTLGVEIH